MRSKRPTDSGGSSLLSKDGREVWARASILIGCVYRAHLEEDDPTFARSKVDGLVDWMDRRGLWAAATGLEQQILRSKLGGMSESLIRKATWKEEGAGALAWYLGVLDDLPVYSQQLLLSGEHLFQGMQFLNGAVVPTSFSPRQDLCPDQCADFYEALTSWLLKVVNGAAKTRLIDSALAKFRCHNDGFRFIGNDLDVGGRSTSELSKAELRNTLSIATERYRAFAWLCGRLCDYDATELELAP